ncbi:tRNA adenosine(34) deaminase TadA [Legionella sp. km772]|uniref:tRNA adenosine(34) deaminase TadA n=1 Tax=Legionella sp. km772 TaxID=2498111 RepID=UPI000F8E35C3|nr:tRNA adenosine(34) deaminase TadA [Legionella sp. km772]RUR08916.1 tRNA adenosine(34) deaminase TadA [Legionella sp. km772]
MNDLFWMEQAYEQALLAGEEGEVPVGAVLVSKENQLLAYGRNALQQTHDPTDHAEIRALRHASATLANHRLLDSTLYVTLEPCAMCAGALVHARVKRVVFATRDFKAGAAGSVYNLLQGYPLNHKVLIDEGIMQQQCASLLQHFFKTCRLDNDASR